MLQRTSDTRTNGERTFVERTIDVVPKKDVTFHSQKLSYWLGPLIFTGRVNPPSQGSRGGSQPDPP